MIYSKCRTDAPFWGHGGVEFVKPSWETGRGARGEWAGKYGREGEPAMVSAAGASQARRRRSRRRSRGALGCGGVGGRPGRRRRRRSTPSGGVRRRDCAGHWRRCGLQEGSGQGGARAAALKEDVARGQLLVQSCSRLVGCVTWSGPPGWWASFFLYRSGGLLLGIWMCAQGPD